MSKAFGVRLARLNSAQQSELAMLLERMNSSAHTKPSLS
jgi:hypothetical protein